jgi:hypothetical protein
MKLTSKLETKLFFLLFGERGKNFHMKEAHRKVQVKKPMSQRDNIQFLPYHGYFYISYKHTRILVPQKKHILEQCFMIGVIATAKVPN